MAAAVTTFVPIPLPPCSTVCCNMACGRIDYAFMAFEVISSVGALIAGVEENYSSCGLVLGALACFAIGHGLVRKYGNVAAITHRFNEAQEEFADTAGKLNIRIRNLEQDNQLFHGLNESLNKQENQYSSENQQFVNQVGGVNKALDAFRESNAKLEAANNQLTSKVADMEKLNNSLSERISDFSKQNADFSAEIKQVSSAAASLNRTATTIQRGDANIVEHLTVLQAEVGQTQLLIREIITGLQKNGTNLESQLAALENERGQLQEQVKQIQAERAKFQEATTKAEETIAKLRQTQDDLEKRIATQSQGSAALQNEASEITGLLKKLNNTPYGTAAEDSAVTRLENEERAESEQDANIAKALRGQ